MRDGTDGYGEGCPRDYVTGETLEGALAFVARFAQIWPREIHDHETLAAWTRTHRADIDVNPAAWCAVELALLDAFSKQAGKTIEALLGLPAIEGKFRYTAVLGDAAAKRFEAELSRYRQTGFRDFKIKLSGNSQRDLDKAALLKAAGIGPDSVRADANNLWANAGEAIAFLARLDFRFTAIEEPLRAGDHAGMDKVAEETGCAIILDESLLRADQLSLFSDTPMRWIVNLRISKMGGLIRSLELLDLIRRSGLRVIIGAHVGETSLLTRAALTIANAARDRLVAQEGAFGTHLLERDVIDPPIMFGAGGILHASQLPVGSGFGLIPRHISG
jgi:L-Ala-D/L-Glu epimerase